jgi:hypothetical protein
MSCCFKEVARPVTGPPDPAKHVNYVQGMVLGVDDFVQEFEYLSARDRWIVRDLVGYGTARGLGISYDTAKTMVTVTQGVGVTPCGQIVCVPESQCADVNKWLAEHGEDVKKKVGDVPQAALSLHVVVSYAESETDAVPIAGAPCRSQDALKQPSRVTDDFLLELTMEPPPQKEENDLREFMGWLRSIPVGAGTPVADFRNAIRAWKPGAAPPAVNVPLVEANARLRDALRIWITELRPAAYGRSCGCASSVARAVVGEDTLLLATLGFDVEHPVDQPWRVKTFKEIDETQRPLLLHLRALQERVLSSGGPIPGPGPGPGPVPPPPIAPQEGAVPEARPGRVARANDDAEPHVVAAGTVRFDAAGAQHVFGGLQIAKVGAGKVGVTFKGYRKPGPKRQYIVRALGVSHPKVRHPDIRFLEFDEEGFVLQVTQGGRSVKAETLKQVELMLEVVSLPVGR